METFQATLIIFLLYGFHVSSIDQAAYLNHFLATQMHGREDTEWESNQEQSLLVNEYVGPMQEDSEDDLILAGLPGQPTNVNFKQYSGYVTVNESHGRRLFYYFVEAESDPTSKPLLLWLNGGPGCSSLGVGAMMESGPFGVKSDGRTLYLRKHSWNKVASVLYLESPAGVGFSYSNTSSDYYTTGDSRTARDSYIFLVKWFEKFPHYKTSDFYIGGESYAGYYIPELADTIFNMYTTSSSAIQLKGILIGNGIVDQVSDLRGTFDYLWTHAMISDETYEGLIEHCMGPTRLAVTCEEFQKRINYEMGNIDPFDINSEPCAHSTSQRIPNHRSSRDCETKDVTEYFNLPRVQYNLHVSKRSIPYAWGLCSTVAYNWSESPSSMLPIYKKLIVRGNLQILLYSGDMDAVIPVTSTRYSIRSLNLSIKIPWRPWLDTNEQVGGYRVDYEGLTFATVRGGGHEVPRSQPERAFTLLNWFLKGL